MRFTIAPLLALLSLPVLTFAKATPHEKLVELAAVSDGVIRLDDATFELLTSPKRTWSASIQFTALSPNRRCALASATFDPSWNSVSKAWTKVSQAHKDAHFFATIDFDDAQSVFQKLGIASAPLVFNYPAADGPRRPASGRTDPVKVDFTVGFDPAPLAEQLSKWTPVKIPYTPPINWGKWATGLASGLTLIISLRYIQPIVTSKWTWAAGSVIISLVMTSGYMFTQIRSAPWNGGPGQWIAAGYQNQFGQEVQVISGLYGLLAVAFLMLIIVIPKQNSNAARQRTQVYLWTTVILILYSLLVSIFKLKNRGYPFKLFL